MDTGLLVAILIASAASRKDVKRAVFRSGIEKACSQYFSVNPLLIAKARWSLFSEASANEKTAITAIGISV